MSEHEPLIQPVAQDRGPGTDPASHPNALNDLEQPLLLAADDEQDTYSPFGVDTFWATTFNIAKLILGAGIMVIPKAFQLMGAVLGTLLLFLVGGLAWFTVSALVYAGEQTGRTTYASMVERVFGRASKWVLLAAVVVNCFGLNVVYMVIFADVLVGTANNGILMELFPVEDSSAWWLSRKFVLGMFTLVFLSPLALRAKLSQLGPLNIIGLASVGAFAVSLIWLAVAAVAKGVSFPLTLFPAWSDLGQSSTQIALALANVVPLLLAADVCHMGVFPAMAVLKPYSRQRMNAAVAIAMALCNVLYFLVALASCIVFGPSLESNVLNNLSVGSISDIVGSIPANLIAHIVRIGYMLSLVGTWVLLLYPLRQGVMEMVLGNNYVKIAAAPESAPISLPINVCLIAALYLTAVFVPDIWVVMSLVGSVASTTMAFIFPALAMVLVAKKRTRAHAQRRWLGGAVAVLGAALFINGFLVHLV